MKVLWLVTGYNSWTNKNIKRVFINLDDAEQFKIGLTDANIYMHSGSNIEKAINDLVSSI